MENPRARLNSTHVEDLVPEHGILEMYVPKLTYLSSHSWCNSTNWGTYKKGYSVIILLCSWIMSLLEEEGCRRTILFLLWVDCTGWVKYFEYMIALCCTMFMDSFMPWLQALYIVSKYIILFEVRPCWRLQLCCACSATYKAQGLWWSHKLCMFLNHV